MANYISDFEVLFKVVGSGATLKIEVYLTDTTDYASYGETADATYAGYVTSIKDPQGTEIYATDPQGVGTPDLDFDAVYPTTAKLVEIEPESDGWFRLGEYDVTFHVIGGSTGHTYTLTKQLDFQYKRPTFSIARTIDLVTPLLKSVDNTEYDITGYTTTLSLDHSIVSSKAGEPNVTESGGANTEVSTARFFNGDNAILLELDLQYESNNGLKITETISYEEDFTIIDIGNLCQISALVDKINLKYENTRKISASSANVIYNDWTRAVGLLVQIREALSCGDKDGLTRYAEEIRDLAQKHSCINVEDSPQLVEGLSALDNNTVTIAYADQDNGFGFSFTPTSTTEYFAFLDHNKKYTPVKADYDGLWIKYSAATSTDHNALQNLQGGQASEYYHLTDSEYTDLKALLYQPPTLSLTPSTLGGTYEVGQLVFFNNQQINVSVGNPQNVHLNRLYYDGTFESPIPNSYIANISERFSSRGSKAVSEAHVLRSDNFNQVNDDVRVQVEYAIYYMAFPAADGDLLDDQVYSDQDVQTILSGGDQDYAGLETKLLRENKNIGGVTINPVGQCNIYILCPVQYGTPKIATQAFPTAYVNTTTRNLTYVNSISPSITTAYVLVKMDDPIGGQYLANFS